jgi:hypothetical protein
MEKYFWSKAPCLFLVLFVVSPLVVAVELKREPVDLSEELSEAQSQAPSPSFRNEASREPSSHVEQQKAVQASKPKSKRSGVVRIERTDADTVSVPDGVDWEHNRKGNDAVASDLFKKVDAESQPKADEP